MTYEKPLPEIGDLNGPFWEATRNHELKMQKCTECGHVRYPISHVCPECLGETCEWISLSGCGTVLSTVVFHQVYNKAFKNDVPYNVSLIQLNEGPRMFSNVVEIAPSEVKVGQPVEVLFDAVTDEVTIPRFRPTGA